MSNVLIFAGFFAFVGVFIALAIAAEKRRAQRQREACEAAGVSIRHGLGLKDEDAARYFFDRTGLMRELRTGAKGVGFAGVARAGDREVVLVEHSYTSGSGKSQHTVRHAIVSVAAPGRWPDLRITPEGIFRKLAELVGMKDIQLENPAFNDRWRVKTADEDFAVVLISPEMQAWLAEWPREYWVTIGEGAISVVASGHITPARLPVMIRLVTELADLIPPELEMWGVEEADSGQGAGNSA
ncbi:MAG: hypothetical protein IT436_12975 [Phycisphaerales bacterium]|nr:hypothetical protein [Phycisphaerales bacterium]